MQQSVGILGWFGGCEYVLDRLRHVGLVSTFEEYVLADESEDSQRPGSIVETRLFFQIDFERFDHDLQHGDLISCELGGLRWFFLEAFGGFFGLEGVDEIIDFYGIDDESQFKLDDIDEIATGAVRPGIGDLADIFHIASHHHVARRLGVPAIPPLHLGDLGPSVRTHLAW